MKGHATIQLKGDYGSKSAIAKLVLPDMEVEDYTTMQTKANAFYAAIVAAGLTGCSKGDVITSQKSESMADSPGTECNIKEKLYYAWRTTNDSRVRRGTISGVPKDATVWVQGSDGDELNATAKAALGTALTNAYGLTDPNVAIVLWGRNKE